MTCLSKAPRILYTTVYILRCSDACDPLEQNQYDLRISWMYKDKITYQIMGRGWKLQIQVLRKFLVDFSLPVF